MTQKVSVFWDGRGFSRGRGATYSAPSMVPAGKKRKFAHAQCSLKDVESEAPRFIGDQG